MIEFLLDLLHFLLQEWSRFYACLILAIAISCLVLLLVPSRNLSIGISIAIIISGIVGGVAWERRYR
jgi:hypothetical protein